MNKTEKKAYDWLLSKGIDKEDITFQNNATPDFIVRGGLKYEVKLSKNKKVIKIFIFERQFDSLKRDYKNTKILIFRKEKDYPIKIMGVNKLYKGMGELDGVKISWIKHNESDIHFNFECEPNLWEDFKKCLRRVFWEKGITINDGLKTAIKDFIDKNGK